MQAYIKEKNSITCHKKLESIALKETYSQMEQINRYTLRGCFKSSFWSSNISQLYLGNPADLVHLNATVHVIVLLKSVAPKLFLFELCGNHEMFYGSLFRHVDMLESTFCTWVSPFSYSYFRLKLQLSLHFLFLNQLDYWHL